MPSSPVKKESKRNSRCLTREISMANQSMEELYEGTTAAIPFTWESQPGTPKVKLSETPLPPLTPPPSYYYNAAAKRPIKHSKPKFLHSIFPKRSARKLTPSSSSSSSPTSSFSLSPSSYSVPSSPMTPSRFRGRGSIISSPKLSFDSRPCKEDQDEYESPVSTLCFGIIRGNTDARFRGCYSSIIKAVL